MEYTFPVPPSVNTYWGFSGHRRFLTQRAISFKIAVLEEVQKYSVAPLAARLAVGVVLSFPDRRVRDLDNHLKSLLDAMTQAGVWVDDGQIDRLVVERAAVTKNGYCKVTVNLLE